MDIRFFRKARRGWGAVLVLLLLWGMVPTATLAAPWPGDAGTATVLGALNTLEGASFPEQTGPSTDSGTVTLSEPLAYTVPDAPSTYMGSAPSDAPSTATGSAVTASVYLATPSLAALPPLTNQVHIAVSGSSVPGATVSLFMSKDGGTPAAQGTVAADTQGQFSFPVAFSASGSYGFTVNAALDGKSSLDSSSVTTTVDLAPPGPATQLAASNPAYNAIQLQWSPPADSDVDHYFIDRDGQLLATVQSPSFTDSDLQAEAAYCYGVTAVDRAGNQSDPATLCAGTLPADKLTDVHPWYANYYNLHHLLSMSRDGSTLVYTDVGDSGDAAYQSFVHTLDVATLAKKDINPAINQYSDSYDLAIDGDGQVIAFSSYVGDYTASNSYHVYLYDGSNQSMTNITNDPSLLGEDCIVPTLSADGQLVALECGQNDLFLYDRHTSRMTLIDSMTAGNYGNNPIISGDGSTIVFRKTIWQNNAAQDYITIYDVASAKVVRQVNVGASISGMSVSEDGMWIAYSQAGNLHVYDRAQDKEIDLANPDNLQYGDVLLSSDGKKLLASYSHSPTQAEPRTNGVDLHDVTAGTVLRTVGSLAIDTQYPTMDGAADKIAFQEGDAFYMECIGTGGCTKPATADPIDAVSWSVPDSQVIGGELKPGASFGIQATGTPGQQLQAVVSYTSTGGTAQDQTVALVEDPGVPGTYNGSFPIPDGATAITALVAKTADHAFEKPATQRLPVKIGGVLAVAIHTAYPAALAGLRLVVSSRTVHMSDQEVDLQATNNAGSPYAISLPDGTDYTVQLLKGTDVVVQQDNVAVTNGGAASLTLDPVFPASLTVTVDHVITNKSLPLVQFTDAANGQLLGDVAVTRADDRAPFTAALTGQVEGKRVKVSVEGDSVYFLPSPQEVTLLPWDNNLTMTLDYEGTIVPYSDYRLTDMAYSEPIIGSNVSFEVWSKPGAAVQVKVLVEERGSDGQLQQAEHEVDLSEAGPSGGTGTSVFKGSFPIAAGIAKLDSYTVAVNGTAMPSVHTINRSVLGKIDVAVQGPLIGGKDDWRGLYLGVTDETGYQYAYLPLDGSASYPFDLPSDHSYTVAEYLNGKQVRSAEPVAMHNGELASFTLAAVFPAILSGTTVDQDGKPLARESLTLYAADGTELSSATSGADGTFALKGAWTGSTVTLKAIDAAAGKATVVQKVTMAEDALQTVVTVKMNDLPKGGVSGTVVREDGQPAAGARVIATVHYSGLTIPFSVQADNAGKYTMALPEGEVSIHAETDSLTYSDATTGQVSDGQTLAIDLSLVRHVARINVLLYTKYAGSAWEGPIGLDWRVEVHFGLTANYPIVTWGNPLEVKANPGDTVKVCVNGDQADLPNACQSVVVDANRQGTALLRLQQQGGIVDGTVDGPAGGFRATFYHLNAKGQVDDTATSNGSAGSSSFEVQLAKSGAYKVNITDVHGNEAGLWKTFELSDGQRLDLGSLKLQPFGLFEGQAGNRIGVTPGRLAPGGTAEVDVSYANASPQAAPVQNGSIAVTIPQGLSLVEHSLSVNGQSVEGSLDNGLLLVPIGSLRGGDRGQIRFQVKSDPTSSDEPAYLTATIRYTGAAGSQEEQLGTADLERTLISLEVPPYLTSLTVPLSGMAPAGSSVTVYDGPTAVGEATASPIGFWQLDAHLPDQTGTGPYHHLRAESISGSERETTEETIVPFDATRTQLTSVEMSQPDGRVVTFDPSAGVARFPYVYISGGFIFKLTFKQPDRVTHVRVYMNGKMADATLRNGVYEAYVNPDRPGPVWVDYDVLPDPEQPAYTVPNDQQLRDSLPAEWRDFKITKVTVPPGGGAISSQPQTASVEADLNADLHATLDFTYNKADYTPTDSDRARAQAYGEPVYGLNFGRQIDGDTLYFTISGYVDASALPTALLALTKAAGNEVAAKPLHLVQTAGFNPETILVNVKFGLKFFNENGGKLWSAYSMWDSVQEAVKTPPQPIFARLKPLQDIAAGLCNPGLRSKYEAEIESMKGDILENYAFQKLIDIAGNAFDVDTLGMAAFIGISTSKMKDMVANAETEDINQLAEELKQANHCGNLHLKWWPTSADIVPIADPSGYVYEGIPSNRLNGVTATALIQDDASGSWMEWDASWYAQANPMDSDAKGQYGWFVPDGTWKVRFTKDGYSPAESAEMKVPPPRTNVNVGLTSFESPVVVSERAMPGGSGVEVAFSKPMLIDSFAAGGLTLTDSNGTAVTGAVYGIDTEKTDAGNDAAMAVRFTPDASLTVGQSYRLAVSGSAVDYAHVGLAQPYTTTLTIEQADQTAPANPGDPEAVANDSQLMVSWTDPIDLDDAKTRITWRKAGSDSQPGHQLEVDKGVQWAQLSDLDPGTTYVVTLAAVDTSGNVSPGVTLNAMTTGGSGAQFPQNVSDLTATPHASDIALAWTDPAGVGLSKVAITWQDAAGLRAVQTGEAAPGAQAFQISGLASDTDYRITVTTVNGDGHQSRSQTLEVHTLQVEDNSDSGKEGDGASSGPAPTPTPTPQGERVQIGSGSGNVSLFGGRLTLSMESGTLEGAGATAEIDVKENNGTVAVPTGELPMSSAFTLSGPDGLQLAKPLTLKLVWDPAALGKRDSRRLGLYRQSEQDPNLWTYVGGVVAGSQGSIAAGIDRLGTYAVLLYDHPFADVQEHWSQPTVDVLVSRHIVSGVDDAHFEPDRTMTRAELAALLVKYANRGELNGSSAAAGHPFADVSPIAWYAAYVAKAFELQLINGDNGRFRPDDPVTREEMVAMMLRAFAIEPNGQTGPAATPPSFADEADISGWSKADLAWAVANGIVSGYQDGTLRPQAASTRAEVATVMLRLLDKLKLIETK